MSNKTPNSKLEQFKTTYSYKELIKKHSLSEEGTWKVLGEDPNADFGGQHFEPDLGMFEGKLEDIIAYAVTLSSFWSWGAGGTIEKVGKPIKITAESNAARVRAQKKVDELEEMLAQARNELRSL